MFRFCKPSRKIGHGGVMPKTRALGRLVRWPKYIQLQRQRKVLFQRLRIPPALNIFNAPAGRNRAQALIRLFNAYKPETRKEKKERLRAKAKAQADKKPLEGTKPILVKSGFNHVTDLIEAGRAKLVLIAHDVDPIELVLWMPTLCVKKNIPFAIIRGKSRLGVLVNKKTASCVALCDVRPEDEKKFSEIVKDCSEQYNARFNYLKKKNRTKDFGYQNSSQDCQTSSFQRSRGEEKKGSPRGRRQGKQERQSKQIRSRNPHCGKLGLTFFSFFFFFFFCFFFW